MKIVMFDTNVLRDLIKNEAKAKEKLASLKTTLLLSVFFISAGVPNSSASQPLHS
jgi:hypothetical protein